VTEYPSILDAVRTSVEQEIDGWVIVDLLESTLNILLTDKQRDGILELFGS
jgi:hypothetical protein